SSGVTLRDVRYSPKDHTLSLEIDPESSARYTTSFIGTRKGYDSTRKPVLDNDDKPLPVTQRYSDDVGQVLATAEGISPRYTLTGDELYVRAVVTSSLPPDNPSFTDQLKQAWTQPIGWESQIPAPPTNKAKAK
ncbi:hypothetical protein ACYOEI_11550, partial [Singulisphaera rosea]